MILRASYHTGQARDVLCRCVATLSNGVASVTVSTYAGSGPAAVDSLPAHLRDELRAIASGTIAPARAVHWNAPASSLLDPATLASQHEPRQFGGVARSLWDMFARP